jgi:N-6 DNA Methylase.
MAEESHIAPIIGERPSQFAERAGQAYAASSIQKDKKHKGQFFTPLSISEFMGRLATPSRKKDISVLDPGCGLAILSCALIEHLVEAETGRSISTYPFSRRIRELFR